MHAQTPVAPLSRRSLSTLVLVALAACGGGGGGGGGGPTLSSIEVTPAGPSLAAGTSAQLAATGIFSDGSTLDLTEDVTWTSDDALVATVDDTPGTRGHVVAAAMGSVQIEATLDAVVGSTTLTVTAAVLVAVEVTPTNPSIALGTGESFVATGLFSDGTKQDLTGSATWDSSDPGVATSAAGGVVASLATGVTSITATVGVVSGSSDLTVTPAALVSVEVTPTNPSIALGTGQPFVATGIFTDASKQDLTAAATWSSSATGVATVGSAPGSFGDAQSVATGTAAITADVGGVMGTSQLTVTAAALVSIGVTPANPSVPLGLDQGLVATGVYTDASTQDLTDDVTWSSSDPAVVQVSNAAGSRGLAASLSTGAVTVTATLGAVSGTTGMTVTAATLVSIGVTPATPMLPLGTQQVFLATGVYTDGSTVDLSDVAVWSSTDPAVATVSNAGGSSGLAQSLAVGSVTVSAAKDGVSGSTTLTVGAATLSSLAVTPSNPDLPLGVPQTFTATGTYTDATTLDLTTAVTWSSSDPAVAAVSNAPGSEGLVTSLATGAATVTATLGAVSGGTLLSVSPAILTSIDVDVDSTTVPLGFEEALVATGFYSDGSSKDLTTQVAWTSSDPSVATVSNAAGSEGLLSSAALGTTTVSATLGAVAGTTDMTVTAAVLTGITILPDSPTIALGGGQQFTATGTYSDGTTQDLTGAVLWDSSDPAVATVSNASRSEGLVTSVATGSSTVSASFGGVSGGTALTVSSATLTSITIAPVASSIALGTLAQFTATGNYSDGSTQDLTTTVTWSSSDEAVATISNAAGSEGVVTSVATGSVTITATFGALGDSTSLDVLLLTLLSIEITPADATVASRVIFQYTATGTFNDGSMQDLTISVAWKSSDNPICSISAKGVAKPHKEGTADITATLSGVTGATTVTIVP